MGRKNAYGWKKRERKGKGGLRARRLLQKTISMKRKRKRGGELERERERET